MNGMQQRNRTFGELLTELKARLSFVAQGPSANNNNPVLNSFLQEGHEYLYAKLQPTPARKLTTVRLIPGSWRYDFNNDAEDERIDPASVATISIEDADGERYPVIQGVTPKLRADKNRGRPTRYDNLNGQIELWPIPDQAYGLVIEYIAPRPRFLQPSDRPGVPDRLILLYAIANAKAHYRHPDAQAAGATFADMLKIEQANMHESRRYLVSNEATAAQTVQAGPNGYTYRVS